jgi:hypothetical protein
MAPTLPQPQALEGGQFVRVRPDHPDSARAGKDAIVGDDLGDGTVGLFFGYDRYNQPQGCQCVGRELWKKDELDLATVY